MLMPTLAATSGLRPVLAEGDSDVIEEYANGKMHYRIEHPA